MAGAPPPREQALSLLAAVNNHGDLAVKLSSLKQVKEILLNVDNSLAAELFPYLAELQSSPETLVRKYLVEVIAEIGAKTMEHLSILMPVLLTFLKDTNPTVAKQSIISGTILFSGILEELSFQFQRNGIVERWLEELWAWMIKFRDVVLGILFEVGSVGPKLLAMKFLETYVLRFTLDTNHSDTYIPEAKQGREFNISRITNGHPVLDAPALASDANRYLGILLDVLRLHSNSHGSLIISAVNSLAAIARRRSVYYNSVLTALLDFKTDLEMVKGCHTVSIQYSLRTAFLGFLRCTDPVIAESRDRLLKVLRAMNAGDAADQVIRQIDKITRNNERASREIRLTKDDQLSNQLHIGEATKKRSAPLEHENQNSSFDDNSKRLRYAAHSNTTTSVNDAASDHVNGISPKLPVLGGDLTPVEQMVAMIGALIAEGERGVESLEILISNIHPDLLADIVVTNMKHLPQTPPPLTKYGDFSLSCPDDSSSDPTQAVVSNGSATFSQSLSVAGQVTASSNLTSLPLSDVSNSSNFSTDSKRDPRRDPRRLDPRRMVVPVDMPSPSAVEDTTNTPQYYVERSDFDASTSSCPPVPLPLLSSTESISMPLIPKTETDLSLSESHLTSEAEQLVLKDEIQDMEVKEVTPDTETTNASHLSTSSISKVEDTIGQAPMDVAMLDEAYSPSSQETDQLLLDISNIEASEISSSELPVLPPYMELTEDHERNVRKLALERIVNSYQDLQKTDIKQTQMALVARLFGQTDVSDVVGMVQKYVVTNYKKQGHELVMHILYHLHSLVISYSMPSVAAVYDNVLLEVAKSLLNDLPASDKSFSRLLGEIPYIPESVLRLLENICTECHSGADGHDGDRVTQGLGAVWSLILGRPLNRRACLDIVLKCAVHPKDDVRAKAIRLVRVANKLYVISYISENIEQFATDTFLSSIDQSVPGTVLSQPAVSENRIEGQVESQETSISGSQVSDAGISQNDCFNDSSVSFSQAQGLISLFFALCTKKPSLLQLVFENYARAPKAVKQAVHRHIPVLIRALDSSYSEVLRIISNPPQGSQHLLIQVLHVMTEGKTPSAELVATVKYLYETRLKDAAILIPVLSAFSRDEVLPIFPQLVHLPLDKFQAALAHILQGSAHTGPALTPVEVLVAIHDVTPERDSLPLKKITDACSACFEQRTVFTQQVLSKALNQMVNQTPLPLLLMRTVIQAIDAFPTLLDFVMEILSKLVHRQIWRNSKLWFGFLKCISQTQPHSFHVLLQLPSPQLESALYKYGNLRGPLTAFVTQSSFKNSLPSSKLALLGLSSGANMQVPSSFEHHSADPGGSSVRGATFS